MSQDLIADRSSSTSRFAVDPPFPAIVYDDKVKQRGAPGEYVGNFDYLLQYGSHVVIANATRHTAHCMKT